MAGGDAQQSSGTGLIFVSLHFCLQIVHESTAELGSHSHAHQGCGMRAVCFQRTALCGDKEIPAFWGNPL